MAVRYVSRKLSGNEFFDQSILAPRAVTDRLSQITQWSPTRVFVYLHAQSSKLLVGIHGAEHRRRRADRFAFKNCHDVPDFGADFEYGCLPVRSAVEEWLPDSIQSPKSPYVLGLWIPKLFLVRKQSFTLSLGFPARA